MHTIVGIDPGKTSAIAVLDMNGRLLLSAHRRFAGMQWIVDSIRTAGTPAVIAGDKIEANDAVRKVNAIFEARLFCPSREITIEEKRLLGKEAQIKDPHERDAYAAAVKAYRYYASKLKQAEHLAAGTAADRVDEIKAKVVARYSISEAMENRKSGRR